MGPDIKAALVSLGVACLPLLTGGIFLRWMGRLDLEPRRLLASVWLFGATFGTFFGLQGSRLLLWLFADRLGGRAAPVLEALLVAPLAEELAKGLVLILLWRAAEITRSSSGLFYGGAVGMGFATAENLVYFLQSYALGDADDWRISLVTRTLFAAWMHVAASASFGLWLGLAMEGPRPRWKRRLAPLLALGTAWALHALWNTTLYLGQANQDRLLALQLFGTVPLIGALLLLAVERSVRAEERALRAALEQEAEAGLIPSAHAAIVAAHRRRRGRGWLPAGVARDSYVRALLRLALRHHAHHAVEIADPALAARQQQELRARIRRLLPPPGDGLGTVLRNEETKVEVTVS